MTCVTFINDVNVNVMYQLVLINVYILKDSVFFGPLAIVTCKTGSVIPK